MQFSSVELKFQIYIACVNWLRFQRKLSASYHRGLKKFETWYKFAGFQLSENVRRNRAKISAKSQLVYTCDQKSQPRPRKIAVKYNKTSAEFAAIYRRDIAGVWKSLKLDANLSENARRNRNMFARAIWSRSLAQEI